MRFIPKTDTIRKSLLIYRRIRHRSGHGVHSPFVFNLITKVIRENGCYYFFHDIELLRKKLLMREEKITYPDWHSRKNNKIRTRTISEIVRGEAISPKSGRLLFRLVNYFKPEKILMIGPTVGLSTLYLTSYRKGVESISLEQYEAFAALSRSIYEEVSLNPVQLRTGGYKETLEPALKDLGQVDFVYLNAIHQDTLYPWMFTTILTYSHPETVLVVKGIKSNKRMREFWQLMKEHPKTTVTLDLFSMGIVLLNNKLHKRNYKVYF